MQSKFGFHGLPLCLSGFAISHPSLSTEMADHDRRREAMRRQKSSASTPERADREIRFTRTVETIRDGGEIQGVDPADYVDNLCESSLTFAAKAA